MNFHIDKNVISDKVSLYLMEKTPNGRKNITIGEYGKEFILKELNPGEKIEPFLEIPSEFFEELVQAVLDYTDNRGIKSLRQTFIEGELEATKKHLDDSRTIINKLLKIK